MNLFTDTANLISGLSAIAAWLAALFAYWSYRASKRTLALAEKERAAKDSNITAYLADSFRVINTESSEVRYIFSIAYSNKSENIDSISEIHLNTYYINADGNKNHLISTIDEDGDRWLIGTARSNSMPIIIQPRTTITGWFVFSVPKVARDSKQITKYKIVARNSMGQEAEVESYILRDIKI